MTRSESSLKKRIDKINKPAESPCFLLALENSLEAPQSSSSLPSLFHGPAISKGRSRSLVLSKKLLEHQFLNIEQIYSEIQEKSYSLGEDGYVYNKHFEHLRHQIASLIKSPELKKQILQLKKPIVNQKTEQLIRYSLRLKKSDRIQDLDIQTLCLSAFLTPLRQSVGSCFATAPAILIQQEQPYLFFQDLEDLLNQGLLKRTFSGEELSIPLSPSWGLGSLNTPFLFSFSKKPWKSLELMEMFSSLNLLSEEWRQKEKEAFIESTLLKKLRLEDGQVISLNQILKSLLLFQHKLNEDELTQKTDFQYAAHPSRRDLQPCLSELKKEVYFQDLQRARLQIVQLEEHPFLKSWEYTLASFAESKSDFYKWNLYTSLGFDSKDEHGIAKVVYEYLQETIEAGKVKIQQLDQDYEQEFHRVKYLEKRLENTESDQMASWARIEYQNHINDLNSHIRSRDDLVEKINRLAKLLPKLIHSYDELFPRYFQELYDANMQDYSKGIYEDSPAGFRLIYKHGRQDPSLWTFITNQDEFIHYLNNFFVSTENELLSQDEFQGLEKELLAIGTLILRLIQSKEFLEAAYERICKRYQIPFQKETNYDALRYKPWAYISGGTLKGLLRNYYRRDYSFHEEQKKIASETELMAFLIEVVGLLTKKEIQKYADDSKRSLLMYSPTHAFLFKPGLMPLEEIWNKDVYSFSWIRDEFVLDRVKFVESIQVNPVHVSYFLETLAANNPYLLLWLKENIQWPNYKLSICEFSNLLSKHLHLIPHNVCWPPLTQELVESCIYDFFPLVNPKDLPEIVTSLLQDLPLEQEDFKGSQQVAEALLSSPISSPWVSSKQLYRLLKETLVIHFDSLYSSQNWPLLLLDALRKKRLAMPAPFFFADTNWPYFSFAFVVSPSSLKLELWRVDALGQTGFPMKAWGKKFQEKDPSLWGILTKPSEYEGQENKFLYNPV